MNAVRERQLRKDPSTPQPRWCPGFSVRCFRPRCCLSSPATGRWPFLSSSSTSSLCQMTMGVRKLNCLGHFFFIQKISQRSNSKCVILILLLPRPLSPPNPPPLFPPPLLSTAPPTHPHSLPPPSPSSLEVLLQWIFFLCVCVCRGGRGVCLSVWFLFVYFHCKR